MRARLAWHGRCTSLRRALRVHVDFATTNGAEAMKGFGAILFFRKGGGMRTQSTGVPEGECGDGAGLGAARRVGRRRLRVRRAREPEGAHRHHRAHRLLVDRHGARARPVQEARHRVDDLQGGVVGRHPRPPHARREPGDAHAPRHPVRGHHGTARLAGEADDHPDVPQPERAGDHADEGAARQGREDAAAAQAARARGQGQGHADDVRDDVPAGHPRDVDRATGSAPAASTPTAT